MTRALFLCLLFLCACFSAPEGGAPSTSTRLIAGDPPICDSDDVFREEIFQKWDLSDSASNRVDLDLDLDAEEFQALEVFLAEAVGGHLRVSWTTAEGASESAFLRSQLPRKKASRRVRFALAEHPEWRGRIRRLRLEAIALNGSIVFAEATAHRRTIDAKRLAAIAPEACKVDLGGDLRNARFAPLKAPIEWTVDAGPETDLRFAFGVSASTRRSIVFEIYADSEASPIFSETLDPSDPSAQGWQERRIPLGSAEKLWMETRSADSAADSASGKAFGAAFWAHPEIVETTSEPPWSVLLISLDTLRADRLTADGRAESTTPRLDAWAQENAAIFEQAIAQAPWTLPSHFSMLTGLDATRHGVNYSQAQKSSRRRLMLLAEILHAAGYSTGASTGGAYLHPTYGLAQGFDVYRHWLDRKRSEEELSTGIEHALAWLEERRDEPTFFFLHTYAVHDPFRAHEPHFSQRTDGVHGDVADLKVGVNARPFVAERGFLQEPRFELRRGSETQLARGEHRELLSDLYDSGVVSMDEQIGDFLDALRERGLDERLLIVVTSDHGEALLERPDRMGHVSLYDTVLQVPLLIARPDGLGAGRRISQQVRSIDIVPTIIDALGLPFLIRLDGVTLTGLMGGDEVGVPPEAWSYSAAGNHGLSLRLGGRLKYVYNNTAWPPLRGERSLYDLRRDPEESTNLADRPGWEEAHRRLGEYYERTGRGLRVQIANEQGVLRGEILGSVDTNGTTSTDMDCDCLRWIENRRAAFEVPAGESFTITFEKPVDKKIEITGTLTTDSGEFPFALTDEIRSDQTRIYVFREGRWEAATERGGETGFVIDWTRDSPTDASGVEAVDPQLLEQLRQLGYVAE